MSPEEKKETHQVAPGGIKSLRTYESDVAEALGQNNVTVARIAIAENQKQTTNIPTQQAPQSTTTPTPEQPKEPQAIPLVKPVEPPMTVRPPEIIRNSTPEEPHHFNKNILMFFVGVLFISAGIFGGYYFYTKSPLAPAPQTATPRGGYRGILTSNTQKKVFLGSLIGKRLEEVLAFEKTQAKLAPGQVLEVYFVKGTEGEPYLITPEEFISLSTTQSPESVRTSLGERFMFGFHETTQGTEPFIVLKSKFFQNTFTGMLKWEPIMFDDMKSWFATNVQGGTVFEDKIVKNKDVRVLKNGNGTIVLLYSFLDRENLVITTNEATFLEILDRFEKQTYVR